MTENTIVLTDTDRTAVALVATIRAAVNGVGKYNAYVAEHKVTRETVKDHALALAVFAYPSLPPVQRKDGKRTKFGNAVQAAGNGLRAALDKAETETDTTENMLTRSGVAYLAAAIESGDTDAVLEYLAAEVERRS